MNLPVNPLVSTVELGPGTSSRRLSESGITNAAVSAAMATTTPTTPRTTVRRLREVLGSEEFRFGGRGACWVGSVWNRFWVLSKCAGRVGAIEVEPVPLRALCAARARSRMVG